eukprot:15322944-Alexandrium_andersonii.AAC.1
MHRVDRPAAPGIPNLGPGKGPRPLSRGSAPAAQGHAVWVNGSFAELRFDTSVAAEQACKALN